VIEQWGTGNLGLLERLLADPAMMEHLGGPETHEKIAKRQADYERPGSLQFRIVDPESGHGAGWVGLWERDWRGASVYEIGWSLAPEFQGRGLASAASREALRRVGDAGLDVHAFPSVQNAPSNGICRKLGFELLGEVDFEYPPGSTMRCNDWRFRAA
jgi:RimJ/RimL family protein N-acetyltransferase